MSVDGVKIFYLVKDRKKNVIFGEKFQKKISVAIGCCSFSVQNLSNLQNLQNLQKPILAQGNRVPRRTAAQVVVR